MKPLKTTFFTLLSALVLSSCTFLDTSKKEMEAVDEIASNTNEERGGYEEYSQERFNELWGSEKFILFFHADWCPTCRTLEADIKKDLSLLNGHVVFEVNYDTATELKKDYEVLTQSTVIFINANGSIFEKRVNPSLDLIKNFFKI